MISAHLTVSLTIFFPEEFISLQILSPPHTHYRCQSAHPPFAQSPNRRPSLSPAFLLRNDTPLFSSRPMRLQPLLELLCVTLTQRTGWRQTKITAGPRVAGPRVAVSPSLLSRRTLQKKARTQTKIPVRFILSACSHLRPLYILMNRSARVT